MAIVLTDSLFGHRIGDPLWDDVMQRRELAVLLAQTVWGEVVIQPALLRLKSMLPLASAQRMIDSQLFDEERHEAEYRRATSALDESVLNHMPAHFSALANIFEHTNDPFSLMMGMHVCLESFALGAFAYRDAFCRDPEIRRLDSATRRDECRHVEFAPIIARLLRREGATFQWESLRAMARTVHRLFLQDDVVDQVSRWNDATSRPQEPMCKHALDRYRRISENAWLSHYRVFASAALGKVGKGEMA